MKYVYLGQLFWEVRNKYNEKVSSTIVFHDVHQVIDAAVHYGSSFLPSFTLDIEGLEEFEAFLDKNREEFVNKNGRHKWEFYLSYLWFCYQVAQCLTIN